MYTLLVKINECRGFIQSFFANEDHLRATEAFLHRYREITRHLMPIQQQKSFDNGRERSADSRHSDEPRMVADVFQARNLLAASHSLKSLGQEGSTLMTSATSKANHPYQSIQLKGGIKAATIF